MTDIAIPTTPFPNGDRVPVLGLGTWQMGEHAANAKAEVAALKLGISLGLIGAIVGEWFGDTVGLGILLLQAMFNEALPRMWGIIVICGVLGIVLYALIEAIERRWVWWKPEI